jgi:hypothetical protein
MYVIIRDGRNYIDRNQKKIYLVCFNSRFLVVMCSVLVNSRVRCLGTQSVLSVASNNNI